ncbi:ATP-dependent helicase [Marinobacter shengliensis]|uniref:ATP-dependent helicase n=1 Tax=Marinobacter shengliensis TaxID=1389223 RepID=UPI0011083C1C|nr:ATP-dependent helicase [Marinobacter shengliensis]
MDQFNEEQLKAVRAPFGPLAVVAGPGSGKTKVITGRAARLISEENVPGYNVLLVTFTNMAAKEMKRRLVATVGQNAEGVACGTMHSQILKHVLREFPDCPPMQRRGLAGNWGILNPDDRSALLRRLQGQLSERTQGFMSENSVGIEELGGVISLSKNWGFGRQHLSTKLKETHPKYQLYVCALELWSLYEAELSALQVIDFDDILTIGAEAVTECESIRRSLANRFQHIFVDEFQDTNAIQFKFLKAIALEHSNLYVVGDPKQSIYLFRGSMPSIFTLFFEAFPSASVVNLNKNYRSDPRIVALANKLTQSMPDRLDQDRDLIAMAEMSGVGADIPFYTQYASDVEEANAIVDQMLAYRDEGYSWGDMAVLYRKNSAKGVLEQALLANNVPVVVANDKALLERKDSRDLIAFMRAAWQSWDKLAYRRLIKSFSLGITESSFEKAITEADGSCEHALKALQTKRTKNIDRLAEACNQMALLRTHSYARDGELCGQVLTNFVESFILPAYEGKDEAQAAVRDRLAILISEVARLVGGDMDTRDILERFALMETAHTSKSDEAVHLMTIHGSKGLEFPITFCVGVDDESMPGNNVGRDEDLNEERRILFVAITRAKQHLHLSSARRRRQFHQVIKCDPSRFLFDIGLVSAGSRTDTSLTDNPAFSELPPIKIQNPDAAPKKRFGRGPVDEKALEEVQRDPNFNKLVNRFNATVMMCMPAGGRKAPPTRRGIESS